MDRRRLVAGLFTCLLTGVASCRKHEDSPNIRTSETVGDTLFDGKVRMVLESVGDGSAHPYAQLTNPAYTSLTGRNDGDAHASARLTQSPPALTSRVVEYLLTNVSDNPLQVTHVETEFLASELVEAEVEPFKHTSYLDDSAETTEEAFWSEGRPVRASRDTGKESAARVLAKDTPEQLCVWGHFYSAQRDVSCRVTLYNGPTVVAGPFTVHLESGSASTETAKEQPP